MSAVPVIITGTLFPRDKSGDPYPVTIAGWAQITGLEIGGGPVLPPDEVPPIDPPGEPPWQIWPGPGDPDFPGGGLLPDPPRPPEGTPPSTTDKVHPGWNFNDGKNPQYPNTGWYYVYIPAPGEAGPKTK